MADPVQLAGHILDALDERRQISCLSERISGFDKAFAYRVAAEVTRLREARGERQVGRKIGFTNRTIWQEYDVHAPIWGAMYSTTVHPISDGFSLASLVEPRIEPEIVFCLGKRPEPEMDEPALMACISHVAHGFEIVQSLFAGWRFAAADTVAAFGLHGALLHGPFMAVTPEACETWRRQLAGFRIALLCEGEIADEGHSENVLGGGPLSALAHLVREIADDPSAPALQPGEIVSTGTLTRALPVAGGEAWTTELSGLPLEGIAVKFARS